MVSSLRPIPKGVFIPDDVQCLQEDVRNKALSDEGVGQEYGLGGEKLIEECAQGAQDVVAPFPCCRSLHDCNCDAKLESRDTSLAPVL